MKGHLILKDKHTAVGGVERLGFVLQRLQGHGVLRLLIKRAEAGQWNRFLIAFRQQRMHLRKVPDPPGAEEPMRYIGCGFQIRDCRWVGLQRGKGRRGVVNLLTASDQDKE